jgi:hypothetical protein
MDNLANNNSSEQMEQEVESGVGQPSGGVEKVVERPDGQRIIDNRKEIEEMGASDEPEFEL